jgi:hypothetical protein
MTVYDLYLESGPKRRKTMVHVLDLLGCVVVGPTTEQAVEATPDAIRAFRRFVARHGEHVETDAAFETRIAAHVTEGEWLGNGSPSVMFDPDYDPVGEAEVETFLGRFHALTSALRRVDAMAAGRVRATTPEERAAVRRRPHDERTLRKALRRMLEHGWEHLAELSRRPDGPAL